MTYPGPVKWSGFFLMMMQHFECAEAEIEIDQDAGFGVTA